MPITATWADLEPDTLVDRDMHDDIVETPDDVRKLVNALAQPLTSEAYLIHSGRPLTLEPITEKYKPDHQVFVTVKHDFGYIEFFDPEHWSQPVGDPASPEWHTTTSGHFLAGTGVPVDVLIEAVIEFLVTARRPTCVRWREVGGGDE